MMSDKKPTAAELLARSDNPHLLPRAVRERIAATHNLQAGARAGDFQVYGPDGSGGAFYTRGANPELLRGEISLTIQWSALSADEVPDYVTCHRDRFGELAEAQAAYDTAETVAGKEAARQHRNRLIQQSLALRMTHSQISEATGLSRGRISQISQSKPT
jgi:hypothetical protein